MSWLKIRNLALLAGALGCAIPGLAGADPVKHPEKLAIYYGRPELVNGSNGNTTTAAAVFEDYDLVVFAEDMEQTGHPSHSAAAEIIGKLPSNGTRVYGYVDLCYSNPGPSEYNCTGDDQTQLEARVDAWKSMGAKGIFLDQAGCDYGVTRQRQNDIIDYIHSEGLSAFINVWNQADAFSTDRNDTTCNPGTGALTVSLNEDDYTLLESWAVVESEWSEKRTDIVPSMKDRAEAVLPYRDVNGTKIAVTNTVAKANPVFDQRQLDYTWWSAVLYGFDAMAWGESWVYSSEHNQLPFRTRPNPTLGDSSGPLDIQYNGDLHSRTTSAGTILLDTNGHTGRITTKNVVTQSAQRPTDLTVAAASFTPTQVIFEVNSALAPIAKAQIFIDTDNNAATGYIHTDEGLTTVGADYMVDDEDLYVFTGSTQSTWSWQLVSSVTPTGFNTTQVRFPVSLSQIGYSSGATLRMLAMSATSSWDQLDFLPRSPSVAWTAKPNYLTQSGSNSSDLVSGDVTFSEYKQGTKVTFSMDSNGGNIEAFRVMIDADNNASTGVAFWGIGADYMVESGLLSHFVGTTQSDWSWQPIAYNTEFGNGGIGTPHVSVSYLPEHMGFEPGEQITVVMQHWSPTPPYYASLDMLPRSGANTWQVTHGARQQAETADTLIQGNATFSTSNITLTMNSNGGAIDSYRFFIDRDNSSSTGYRHTAQGITGVGADYMIEDGDVYEFCGSSQTTWCWNFVSTCLTDSGSGTSQITAQFAKSLISYTPGSTIALVAESFLSGTESVDHLPMRSASTVWRAKP
ncbi:MAG TPA: hypothetical protein VGE08_09405 [Steroidobacter sp.]|uniref:hypothetical protein n=1 Tax=Steroidobacter sp. TaxID=1978227 RepID=UPI002ED8BF0F